jgi:glutamine cyclotransferase
MLTLICLLPCRDVLAAPQARHLQAHSRFQESAYADQLIRMVHADTNKIAVYGYRITAVHPHDSEAFTQGLLFSDGFFYESTGRYGRSTLRKVDPETGEVLNLRNLPSSCFGEGLALWRERLIQLTWKSGQGFVYDKQSFKLLEKFTYAGEGWGITQDGSLLIMSDGSDRLRFLDPESFAEIREIKVRYRGTSIFYLNELEYVRGEIYANVWQTDLIARISAADGQVTSWIDLSEMRNRIGFVQKADQLNGIAYDSKHDRLWVTGKLWPVTIEIELIFPPDRR